MNDRTHKVRRRAGAPVIWAVALLLLLSGCVAVPVALEPPQVPAGLADAVWEAEPASLALTRADLPAGFQLAAEKGAGPDYIALYLRPTALEREASGGNTLLSVLTSISVYTTTAEAEQVYLAASADPSGEAMEDMALVSRGATDVVTTPYDGAAQGANAAEAFRISYRLQQTPVFEYGHRLRIGNVLAYVVVAAIGTPDEPPNLAEAARDLVQRQIDHIAGAAP